MKEYKFTKTKEKYYQKNMHKIIPLQKTLIKHFSVKRKIAQKYNTPEKINKIIFLQHFFIKRYWHLTNRWINYCILVLNYYDNDTVKRLYNTNNINMYLILQYFLFTNPHKLKKKLIR